MPSSQRSLCFPDGSLTVEQHHQRRDSLVVSKTSPSFRLSLILPKASLVGLPSLLTFPAHSFPKNLNLLKTPFPLLPTSSPSTTTKCNPHPSSSPSSSSPPPSSPSQPQLPHQPPTTAKSENGKPAAQNPPAASRKRNTPRKRKHRAVADNPTKPHSPCKFPLPSSPVPSSFPPYPPN